MILKGSQRGGPGQLAAHLLNQKDNDHVTVLDVRGFVSGDLGGAMAETKAIAKGTRCRQPIFSLSLNPPKDAQASIADFVDAVERAEQALGLEGMPRAVIIHEKKGRRHAHVVWSRIEAQEMKAVNLPFFKRRLNALSKELYLEHGWELPDGHRENGWKSPLNFTLAEWQQAKRHDIDPREIKQIFRFAWEHSDSMAAFQNALESHGYFLARGDRRGFVAMDLHGAVYSVARFAGVKVKDLEARFGAMPVLSSVDECKARIKSLGADKAREVLAEDRAAREAQTNPLREQLRILVNHHRKERSILKDRQETRRVSETKARAEKFRRGLGAILDLVTGRLFTIKNENEREAHACFLRDREQTENLVKAQMEERRAIQKQLEELERRQRQSSRGLIRTLLAFKRSIRGRSRERQVGLGL